MFSYTSRSLFGVSKHLKILALNSPAKVPVPFRALSTPSQPTPDQTKTPSQEPTQTSTPAAQAAPAAPTPSAAPTPRAAAPKSAPEA
ncbi:Aminoacyl-tRNA synthetase class Ic [Penicillium brevicompactum]|uniref:Aminoacyl-tRNA synthetase class Ic n=1 Tax=Penicillium brevicompactum TaxID=5074 RepID=A0A9W9UYJ3_PENBR|nr:Aminoacyl-tRNA synthetase class Ic [Penicillium brevicompactum]